MVTLAPACSGMQGAVMLVADRETRRQYAAKIIDTRKCVPSLGAEAHLIH